MLLIRTLRDCKQRSLTVSKKAPTVSKKASPYQYEEFLMTASVAEQRSPEILSFFGSCSAAVIPLGMHGFGSVLPFGSGARCDSTLF